MSEGRIALAEDAIEVNLGALILENHGLEIEENHPTMGRVMVATESLDSSLLYQPVLRELPALVCKQGDYLDFLEQFLEAPVELQVGILDMYFQPLDSKAGKDLLEPAQTLYVLGVLENFTVIHQLLSIVDTNGHQYKGNHTALPMFGSKMAHSCNPNLGYSSWGSQDGALEYRLLRLVKAGDQVCFSYLSDLLETPTNERRKLLMETKSFWCSCERCNGKDYCRCMPCPTCSSKIPCQYPQQEQSKEDDVFWECTKCGLLETDSTLVVERQMAKTLHVINRAIEQRKDFQLSDSEYPPSVLQELVDECRKELSETHHLTIKALRLLLTTATAHAYVQIRNRMTQHLSILATSPVHGLDRISVVAGYQLVLAGECIAASCTGCQFTSTNLNRPEGDDAGLILEPKHDPNYDRALVMQHLCDNILRLPIFWWPPQTITMTLRYLPILKARFGEQLVQAIELRIVQGWKDATCLDCGTYWDAYTGRISPLEEAAPVTEPPSNNQKSMNTKAQSKSVGKVGRNNKKKNNKKKKRRK